MVHLSVPAGESEREREDCICLGSGKISRSYPPPSLCCACVVVWYCASLLPDRSDWGLPSRAVDFVFRAWPDHQKTWSIETHSMTSGSSAGAPVYRAVTRRSSCPKSLGKPPRSSINYSPSDALDESSGIGLVGSGTGPCTKSVSISPISPGPREAQ